MAVPVAVPAHGSENVNVNDSVLPDTVPARLPSPVSVPVNAHPDCARAIVPLPERPQESLQNMFRDPETLVHEPPPPPGVGVGHGALGGQLFRSHPEASTSDIHTAPRIAYIDRLPMDPPSRSAERVPATPTATSNRTLLSLDFRNCLSTTNRAKDPPSGPAAGAGAPKNGRRSPDEPINRSTDRNGGALRGFHDEESLLRERPGSHDQGEHSRPKSERRRVLEDFARSAFAGAPEEPRAECSANAE